ncbi:MAG: Arylsulfotransferase [Mucilaginibacter sp.]|nr:Arylsulfotransferase [Mucilaginibacter sp.]
MNKKIPLWLALLFLWFSFIITIMFGWAVWHVYNDSQRAQHQISKASRLAIFIASTPHLIKESFKQLSQPRLLVRPNIYPTINGFKFEKKYVDSNYLLLCTYDKQQNQSIVKLIRLSDQKTLHQWKPDFDEIKRIAGNESPFLKATNRSDVRLVHPLLSSDGSIVFNDFFSPLIKINKDSKLVWVINGSYNHSLEYDADGNVWAPSVIRNSRFLSEILPQYHDDAITKIKQNGKVLFQKSIAQILIENGYRWLLLGTGKYEADLLHLNDIQPALISSRFWKKGDLLISLRHKSTVLLYRPETNKIIWLKIGPWISQHDVDFIDSSRIGVFGNNVIRYSDSDNKLIDGYNEEYIYDFKTGKIETPYTKFLKTAQISTITEGRSDVLSNGDLFIEETNNNRLLRGNRNEIIWQYVNKIDDHSVGALSWSRYISKEEFKKLTFLKNN